MASIGYVTCTFVRGNPPRLKQRTKIWQTAGVDGYGARHLGASEAPWQLVTVLYSTAEGLLAWKNALESLQGQVVTIINDLGLSFTQCLIVGLSEMKSEAAVVPGETITQRGEIAVAGVTVG
jgi:hypothetical protein